MRSAVLRQDQEVSPENCSLHPGNIEGDLRLCLARGHVASLSMWVLDGRMWLKQCHKPANWERFIPPTNMVMTGGWFVKIMSKNMFNHSMAFRITRTTKAPQRDLLWLWFTSSKLSKLTKKKNYGK